MAASHYRFHSATIVEKTFAMCSRFPFVSLAALGCLVLTAGCGDSLATVSGHVTLAGQPLAKGQIQFTPASGAPVGASIVAGQYSVKLPPGEMTALISETVEIQHALTTEEMQKQAEAGIRPPPPPKSQLTPETPGNNRPVTIKAGSQTLDFPLGQP